MKYSYYSKDPFSIPINYSYSEFEGSSFIDKYYKSRLESIKKIDKLNSVKSNNSLFIFQQSLEKTGTVSLIYELLKEMASSASVPIGINTYISKFEITKNVFDNYNSKSNEGRFDNLANYISLSFFCLEAFKLSSNYRYLNTSLKLNDILISVLEILPELDYFGDIKKVLEIEISIVSKLEKGLL
tara:strand:- start:51 stop:605 length:555 start_codon:yes stop_codon:yes gene_type:complete